VSLDIAMNDFRLMAILSASLMTSFLRIVLVALISRLLHSIYKCNALIESMTFFFFCYIDQVKI
jgi:hypothetical protein